MDFPVPSVSSQPRRFTNNSLGVPHAPFSLCVPIFMCQSLAHHFKTTFVHGTYDATSLPQHIQINQRTHLMNSKKDLKGKKNQRRKMSIKIKIKQNKTIHQIIIIVRIIIIIIPIPQSTTNHFKTTFMCLRSIAGVRSIRSGASGLPYYCTPPVCVPDVIEGLAVWRQNIKTKFGPNVNTFTLLVPTSFSAVNHF